MHDGQTPARSSSLAGKVTSRVLLAAVLGGEEKGEERECGLGRVEKGSIGILFKGVEAVVHHDGACTMSMARVARSTAIHRAKRAVALVSARFVEGQREKEVRPGRASGSTRPWACQRSARSGG
jgi:hypothetical protein